MMNGLHYRTGQDRTVQLEKAAGGCCWVRSNRREEIREGISGSDSELYSASSLITASLAANGAFTWHHCAVLLLLVFRRTVQ